MGKTHKSTGKVANTMTNACYSVLRSGLSERGGQGKLPGRAGSCNQFHGKGILGKGSQSRREQSRVTWKIT